MLDFFILGASWYLYPVLGSLLLAALIALETRHLGWLSLCGMVIGGIIVFNLIHVKVAFWTVSLFVLAYLLVGAAWSIVRWWIEIRRLTAKLTKEDSKDLSDYLLISYKRQVSVENYKADIMSWIAYWPLSMFWTLVSDLVTNIYKHIYTSLKSIYAKINAPLINKITVMLEAKNQADLAAKPARKT